MGENIWPESEGLASLQQMAEWGETRTEVEVEATGLQNVTSCHGELIRPGCLGCHR